MSFIIIICFCVVMLTQCVPILPPINNTVLKISITYPLGILCVRLYPLICILSYTPVYKNIVSLDETEYFNFSADFRMKIFL